MNVTLETEGTPDLKVEMKQLQRRLFEAYGEDFEVRWIDARHDGSYWCDLRDKRNNDCFHGEYLATGKGATATEAFENALERADLEVMAHV